ncbi:MAG TPA: type II toxin-antitoxin system prevent-host-death family antitoxin [Caulobacterales bacterium]|jgi:prevent-host-death family protein|nr:type II toxin-antitoxin system prevent-host-death family antitoxin [Caulobacterales bacterium]
MTKVTIHAAKTNLSKLIAQAEAGEEVIICRGDEEVVRLAPVRPSRETTNAVRPGRGSWKGHVHFAPDWDAPLDMESLGLGPDGDFK